MEINVLQGAAALPQARRLLDRAVIKLSTNCDKCGDGTTTKEDLVGMLQGPFADRVHYDPKLNTWQIFYPNIG